MSHAGGECISLEPIPTTQEARGILGRSRPATLLRWSEPAERLLREVEPIGEQAQRFLALRRVLGLRQDFTRADESLLTIRGPIELESHAIEQVALGQREPVLEVLGRIGGILAGWKRHDLDLESLGSCELHSTERCLLSRCIGVEAEVDLAGEPAELAQLAVGQRGSHGGHDRLEARLPERDDVGVALDHCGAILLSDRNLGEVQPVQDRSLVEDVPSGELTYFPRSGSSSRSLRAWNPTTRPRASQSGNIRRCGK